MKKLYSDKSKRGKSNLRKLIRRRAQEGSDAAARIITNYDEALKAFGNKEAKIYIEGNAYDVFMEMVSEEEGLSRWLKALGKFYTGPNGLHMLFKTLYGIRPDNGICSVPAGEGFYRFIQEISEEDYQNYKARNSKSKRRFEFVRIR